MLEDNRVRVLHDFPESMDCFPGVEIQGGVCYFLWKRDERGDCAVSTHMNNAVNGPLSRPLLEKGCSTFIRYNQSVSILRKVTKDDYTPFSTLVSAQTPFGLITSYKGTPEKVNPTDIKMYISGNEKQYKDALMSESIVMYQVNFSKDTIENGIYQRKNNKMYSALDTIGISTSSSYDEYCRRWQKRVSKDTIEDYLKLATSKKIIELFNNGNTTVSIDYRQ